MPPSWWGGRTPNYTTRRAGGRQRAKQKIIWFPGNLGRFPATVGSPSVGLESGETDNVSRELYYPSGSRHQQVSLAGTWLPWQEPQRRTLSPLQLQYKKALLSWNRPFLVIDLRCPRQHYGERGMVLMLDI